MDKPASRTATGFSLAEATISIGIVAALLLPLVAMLAGSAGMVTDSRDRFAATRLAPAIEGRLRFSPARDAFVIEGSPAVASGGNPASGAVREEILVGAPGSGGTSRVYLGFDLDANLVKEVPDAAFAAGLGVGEEEIFYLVEVEVARSGDGFSPDLDAPGLYRVTLSIEKPAFADEENRWKETLATLVSAQ